MQTYAETPVNVVTASRGCDCQLVKSMVEPTLLPALAVCFDGSAISSQPSSEEG